MGANIRQNVIFRLPTNAGERAQVAESCVRDLHIEIPALLDDFNNSTEQAYTAWPDRLYLVDSAGRVRYKSKPGPFGFEPDQLKAALVKTLR